MNDLIKRARISCSDDPIGMEKKKFEQEIYSGLMENMRPTAGQTVIYYLLYLLFLSSSDQWMDWTEALLGSGAKAALLLHKIRITYRGSEPKIKLSTHHLLLNQKSECYSANLSFCPPSFSSLGLIIWIQYLLTQRYL